MKEGVRTLMGMAVAAFGGMALGAGLLHAQQQPAKPAAPATESKPAPAESTAAGNGAVAMPLVGAARAAVPGTLQVTRLSDTSFVVVKDTGDAQVITLFATDGGIIQKKHAGKFFY